GGDGGLPADRTAPHVTHAGHPGHRLVIDREEALVLHVLPGGAQQLQPVGRDLVVVGGHPRQCEHPPIGGDRHRVDVAVLLGEGERYALGAGRAHRDDLAAAGDVDAPSAGGEGERSPGRVAEVLGEGGDLGAVVVVDLQLAGCRCARVHVLLVDGDRYGVLRGTHTPAVRDLTAVAVASHQQTLAAGPDARLRTVD